MLQEHEQGRAHVRAIADALPKARSGDGTAVASAGTHLADYVRLLRAHIDKENNVLFPMADRMLTSDDQRALSAAFDKVEAEELGGGADEKYHELAHQLAGE